MYYFKTNKFTRLLSFSFWGGLFFSVWAVFATSTDPLIYESVILKKLFEWDFTGKSIFHNLFIGVVVSYIFYFVVVFLPEKKKQHDLKPLLNDKVYGVVRSISSMISYLDKYIDSDISLYDMKEEDFIEKVGNIPAGLILTENPSATEMHSVIQLNKKVHSDILIIFKLIDDLQGYMPFLDSECVALLSEIRYNKLLISSLVYLENLNSNKIRNQKLNVINKELYNIYMCSRQLQNLNKKILGCERDYPISKTTGTLFYTDYQIIKNFQKAYENFYKFTHFNVNVTADEITVTYRDNNTQIHDTYDVLYKYSSWFCIKSLLVKLWNEHPDKRFAVKNIFHAPLQVEFKQLDLSLKSNIPV